MSIKRLSLDDCQTLISRYNSDLKALDFQADEIKKVLKELNARRAKLQKVASKKAAVAAKKKAAAAKKKAAAAAKKAAATAKKRAAAAKKKAKKAGRPAAKKKAGRPAAKKKAGRPAKRKVAAVKGKGKSKRGRKMSYSDWDQLVLNTLKSKNGPVRTSTLLVKGQSWAKKSKVNSSELYVRGKLGAALQKLVNKTKEVKKVAAEGRGYAYLLS